MVVCVPMDAFRKMFSGMTDSCGGGTKSSPDPIDIYVRSDDGVDVGGRVTVKYEDGTSFVARRPRTITIQNSVTKSGCSTACLLVGNCTPTDVSSSTRLLNISPVELGEHVR
uniref:Uncharacterized protein n=1 Tax=Spodoptera frugiperda ascovirus 1a TaxID=113370 RepID=Q9DKM7_SFAVA|nr:hypothetical protein [Spodoptera frugiperda ascovirus 1a]